MAGPLESKTQGPSEATDGADKDRSLKAAVWGVILHVRHCLLIWLHSGRLTEAPFGRPYLVPRRLRGVWEVVELYCSSQPNPLWKAFTLLLCWVPWGLWLTVQSAIEATSEGYQGPS